MVTIDKKSCTIESERLVKLAFNPKSKLNDDPFLEDIKRIIAVCKINGYEIDYETAKSAWEEYSEQVAATWLILPKDDNELLAIVLTHTENST